MNQGTLIRALAEEFFLTQKETAALLRSLLKRIAQSLEKGDRVALRDFGSFRRSRRAARKVRHPKTGVLLTIPAQATADFRPSPALVKELN